MPTTIVEVDSFDTSIQVPVDGDPRNAASVVAGFQALADRTKNLRKGVAGVSSSFELRVPIEAFNAGGSGSWSDWTNLGGDILGWKYQTDVSGAKALRSRIFLPPIAGYTISSIRAAVSGSSSTASHAGVPATLPTLRLTSTPVATSAAFTTHVTCRETYGSVAVYNAVHNITTVISGALPHTPVLTNQYFLEVTGETGANSVAATLSVYGLYITLSVP